jgi:hypothetical protein
LGVARAKRQLERAFGPSWLEQRRSDAPTLAFPSLRSAVRAFEEVSAAGTAHGTVAAGCDRAELDLPILCDQSRCANGVGSDKRIGDHD